MNPDEKNEYTKAKARLRTVEKALIVTIGALSVATLIAGYNLYSAASQAKAKYQAQSNTEQCLPFYPNTIQIGDVNEDGLVDIVVRLNNEEPVVFVQVGEYNFVREDRYFLPILK